MQKSITLRKAAYEFGERTIFSDVSFTCAQSERLCILGENGAGKSTILKIVAGELPLESGSYEKIGHIRTVYVPQEFPEVFKELTVEQYIEQQAGKTLFKKVHTISQELGFDTEKHAARSVKALSGGQQKLLALSVAFASMPDFILLDEPENHIDIVSRIVLTRMLQEYKGGIIFISHDRLIVDALATKVGELAGGRMHISEGGYEDYIEAKMERLGGLQRAYDAEAKRIKQLTAALVIAQQKAFRGKEVSAYHKTKKELEDLKREHKESGRPDDKKTKINLRQADANSFHGGKLLCRIKDMSFRYPGTKGDMFHNLSLEARAPGHIVLLGRNGTGKSTFLKCLTGEHAPTTGEITWGTGVRWAYFDQHMSLEADKTPFQIVSEKLNLGEESAKAVLGAMRFSAERMKATIGTLSGGEKMRVRFALVFGSSAEFIILDEPTNHLDEVTWEILLEACKRSKSAILLVSHDYEFINEFNPHVFWMIQGQSVVPRYKELSVLLEEMGA